jgi:hypothetical protein
MASNLRGRSVAVAVAALWFSGCYTVPRTRYVATLDPAPTWTTSEERARRAARYLDVSTSRPRYEFYDDELPVSITVRVPDTAPGSVVLRGCPRAPAIYLEQWDGSQWQDAGMYRVFCAAIYSTETVVLMPGESLQTQISLRAPGRYRALVPVGYEPPDFLGVSNEFLVRDSDGR